MNAAKFDLGITVMTPGASEHIEEHNIDIGVLLARHRAGDWGDLCAEDSSSNNEALIDGSRLLSSYDGVWIITEADRSVTTLLLPSEY